MKLKSCGKKKKNDENFYSEELSLCHHSYQSWFQNTACNPFACSSNYSPEHDHTYEEAISTKIIELHRHVVSVAFFWYVVWRHMTSVSCKSRPGAFLLCPPTHWELTEMIFSSFTGEETSRSRYPGQFISSGPFGEHTPAPRWRCRRRSVKVKVRY